MGTPLLHLARSYNELEQSTIEVEKHFWGARGMFARACWTHINQSLFDGALPWTLIVWGITAHSGCLGSTRVQADAAPIITLHPSLLGGTEKDDPWGIHPKYLGRRYAYDVVLHECMHIAVNYLRGGEGGGETSHNCPAWIAEVNRIAPLIGLEGIQAAMSKPTRDKQANGKSKVVRKTESTVPFNAVAKFPHAVRFHLRLTDVYERNELPFDLKVIAV